jgi:hypothetical protein
MLAKMGILIFDFEIVVDSMISLGILNILYSCLSGFAGFAHKAGEFLGQKV